MNLISSPTNKLIKDFKSLKDKKGRKEQKAFYVEGIRFFEEAVLEAVKGNIDIKEVFVAESIQPQRIFDVTTKYGYKKPLNITIVVDKVFNDMSDTETPQGVLAVLGIKEYKMSNLIESTNKLIIIDSIQDPGNLGTIIRTADAAGFKGIIASKGTVDVYNPKVLRSTMGSVFRVPYIVAENIVEAVDKMKASGLKLIGTHLSATKSLYNVELKGKLAFVIGNEGAGMSGAITAKCDELVKIPMTEGSESLNAAIAAAVVMYEVVRQEC